MPGFTAEHSCDRLVYFEMHATMEAAITREKQIKAWRRSWKLNLIESVNPRSLPAALRDFERLRSPSPLPSAQGAVLLNALRRHLGWRGLRLLTAAAAYPEFRWSLVQALDTQLYVDDAATRRELRLLQLAQLPWSRDGWLPEWVRLMLLRRLGRRARECLRATYDILLRAASQDGDVVLPVHLPDPPQILRQYASELLKRGGASGPQQDAVFAEFMLGGRLSRLDFEMARAWEKLLPGASLRSTRGRAMVAFGSVVLAMACGFSWLQMGRAAVAAAVRQTREPTDHGHL